MISFEGKVAVITGAGNGIGLATARLMAAHGARLVLTDIDNARLEEVAAELDPSGQRVYTRALDVSASADCERVFEAAAKHFGGLDHLVHCAGISRPAPIPKIDLADWDESMRVNVTSALVLAQHCMPGMIDRGWGRIVTIGSLYSRMAAPHSGPYAVSKHAILGLTRVMAMETAAKGVTAN